MLGLDTPAPHPWWQGAVIYQVYLRSFLDSNGDGIGDLPGLIARLDYIASLGVDAIWVSPFFRSPMADFGYDIADYRDVDPMFGTLADVDTLLEGAHRRGLRVMIDQVLSHTSAQHPWFVESRASCDNARADWYVWADPKPDGSAPNNWLSIFGGVAWTWEPRRRQYYLHNFLSAQPDLNFHQPQVRRAVLDNVRFWLERGVDGLRLDAVNFCFHDRALRDNPPKPAAARNGRGFRPDNPYAYQFHYHNNTQPEMLPFLEELRRLVDAYPGVVTLGEVSAEDSNATVAAYTQPGRLHMGYSFELLSEERSPAHVRHTVERTLAEAPAAWPCWAISNHDVERVVSRWGGAHEPAHLATQLSALAASLRGSVCLYQGEELALPEAEVPFEALQDPYGIAFWPVFRGRDGCRTPLPWTRQGGFTSGSSWLPIPSAHLPLAIEAQEPAACSALNRLRGFLRWRRGQPALRWGAIEFLLATEQILAFVRTGAQRLLVAFNLSATTASARLAQPLRGRVLDGHGLPSGTLQGDRLHLPARGVLYLEQD